jgi:hypothetical protein
MPNSNIPGNTSRRLIDRGRIDELRRYGWRVVGAAPGADREWAVIMEGDASATPREWGAWA